jgi:hypothetical protein
VSVLAGLGSMTVNVGLGGTAPCLRSVRARYWLGRVVGLVERSREHGRSGGYKRQTDGEPCQVSRLPGENVKVRAGQVKNAGEVADGGIICYTGEVC